MLVTEQNLIDQRNHHKTVLIALIAGMYGFVFLALIAFAIYYHKQCLDLFRSKPASPTETSSAAIKAAEADPEQHITALNRPGEELIKNAESGQRLETHEICVKTEESEKIRTRTKTIQVSSKLVARAEKQEHRKQSIQDFKDKINGKQPVEKKQADINFTASIVNQDE